MEVGKICNTKQLRTNLKVQANKSSRWKCGNKWTKTTIKWLKVNLWTLIKILSLLVWALRIYKRNKDKVSKGYSRIRGSRRGILVKKLLAVSRLCIDKAIKGSHRTNKKSLRVSKSKKRRNRLRKRKNLKSLIRWILVLGWRISDRNKRRTLWCRACKSLISLNQHKNRYSQ